MGQLNKNLKKTKEDYSIAEQEALLRKLQNVKEDHAKAEHEALLRKYDNERLELISVYDSRISSLSIFSVVSGVLFLVCLIWFSSCEMYTTTSFFFFEMDTISLSWTISLLLMLILGFAAIMCVVFYFNSKSKKGELEKMSISEFISRRDSYLFDTKGIFGLLSKDK